MAEDFGLSFKPMKLPRSRRKKKQEQPQEIDPTVLQSLGSAALGTVGAVGNLLDLPGSMVRDTLAGNNPFDQVVNPFSDKNRISGRDLARQYGMAGKKDTWGNFAGGLATEIATDPLTLLGVGLLGKTTKGAQLAKRGATKAKTLGQGIRSGERALASGKVPFGPRWEIGTGAKAAQIGDKLDKAYEAARYSVPGRYTAAIFDKRTGGRTLEKTQKAWQDKVDPGVAATAKDSRKRLLNISKRLKRIGITNDDQIRLELEGVVKDGPISQKDPVLLHDIRTHLDNELALDEYWGRPSTRLKDDKVQYFPRFIGTGGKRKGEATGKVFTGIMQDSAPRKMATKDWNGGTIAIKGFFKDPDLAEMSKWMEETRRAMVQNGQLNDATQIDNAFVDLMTNKIKEKYAGEFVPSFDLDGEVFDRARELAKTYLNSSEQTRKSGLYNNNPLIDLHRKDMSGGTKRAKIQGVVQALGDYVPSSWRGEVSPRSYGAGHVKKFARMKIGKVKRYHPTAETKVGINTLPEVTGNPNLDSLFRALKLHPKKQAGILLRESGAKVTPQRMKMILETEIDPSLYDDLTSGYDKTVLPKGLEKAMAIPDQATNLFKAGVLTHPARHFRDALGGTIQNLVHGISAPMSRREAKTVLAGKTLSGFTKDPEIAQWVASQGLPLNDETATEALRFLYAAEGPGSTFKHTDVSGLTNPDAQQSITDILAQVPGETPRTDSDVWKDVAKALSGKDGESTWNPFKAWVRGVNKRDKSTFAPFAASDKLGEASDTLNRLPAFINLKRKGYSAREAMKVINDVQVNYDPSTFTAAEKQIFKRLFPFYSYTSKMTKHVAKELATKPGGGLANTIRLQNAARDRSGTTPDHVADTAAIPDPFYKSKDGTKQYLTGLGLMHEDALQFLQPSPQSVTGEMLSRLNPLAQKAIELGTGRSLYFKEPGGGRPIDDLDPTIGRILANVTGREDAVRYPGDWAVEQVNSLLPTSRLVGSVRQLTDRRKSRGAKALSLLTGMKVTTVSPQQQERTLRRKLEEVAKSLGGRTFEQIYFPKSNTYSGETAERVEAYKTVINALSKKAKDRAKEKVKK